VSLNKQEVQNLRHLIGSHETAAKKLEEYAQQCVDPQLKQMLSQSAQEAKTTKNKLLSFLQ